MFCSCVLVYSVSHATSCCSQLRPTVYAVNNQPLWYISSALAMSSLRWLQRVRDKQQPWWCVVQYTYTVHVCNRIKLTHMLAAKPAEKSQWWENSKWSMKYSFTCKWNSIQNDAKNLRNHWNPGTWVHISENTQQELSNDNELSNMAGFRRFSKFFESLCFVWKCHQHWEG